MISKETGALVVMYHYVQESMESSPQGVRPLLTRDFEKQLDWLEDNFRIVSADEFLFTVGRGWRQDDKAPCLLTFDDGTRDHLEVAVPILQRRSLPALFFVLTWPIENQKMPVTHALHWALSQPEDQLWSKLLDFAGARPEGSSLLGSPDEAIQMYHYETRLRGLIKYAVNFAMPPDVAQEFVEETAETEGKTLSGLANEWFLTAGEVQQLRSCGMDIGMHGCSHRSLTQIGSTGMEKEIAHSAAYLKQLLGETPTWFACPFGGADLEDEMAFVHQACRSANVEAVVTRYKGFVSTETDFYGIPRFDCVYLPPRSAELLAD